MNYTFKKLCLEDIDMVVNMNTTFRENFICRENAEIFLNNPFNWLYATILKGEIIGFAYGYEVNRLNDMGNMVYIHEVGVLEQYQRQGIGYNMLLSMKALCKERGVCRFFLYTYQNNIGANALYKKLGGVVSDESLGNDRGYIDRKSVV